MSVSATAKNLQMMRLQSLSERNESELFQRRLQHGHGGPQGQPLTEQPEPTENYNGMVNNLPPGANR